MKDILHPNLTSEERVRAGAPELQRVFTHDLYEIFVGRYPGGLFTTLVHYRRDALRIMSRLGEAPAGEPPQSKAWAQSALNVLLASGRGPFHLVRDAKLECSLLLSLHDRAALRMAGIEIPRSAGRFREVFLRDE